MDKNVLTITNIFVLYLIGVLSGEVLYRRNDSLSNQLTIGRWGLLLNKFCFLAADWSKQAKAKENHHTKLQHGQEH